MLLRSVSIGGYAYNALSRVESDTFSPVFAELGEKFVGFVDVLSEVSERTSCASNADLLRVYEKWLKTGSRRSGQLLVEQVGEPGEDIAASRFDRERVGGVQLPLEPRVGPALGVVEVAEQPLPVDRRAGRDANLIRWSLP